MQNGNWRVKKVKNLSWHCNDSIFSQIGRREKCSLRIFVGFYCTFLLEHAVVATFHLLDLYCLFNRVKSKKEKKKAMRLLNFFRILLQHELMLVHCPVLQNSTKIAIFEPLLFKYVLSVFIQISFFSSISLRQNWFRNT